MRKIKGKSCYCLSLPLNIMATDYSQYLDQSVAAYYILHHMQASIADPSLMFSHLDLIDYIKSVIQYPEFNYTEYYYRCTIKSIKPAIHHIEAKSGF